MWKCVFVDEPSENGVAGGEFENPAGERNTGKNDLSSAFLFPTVRVRVLMCKIQVREIELEGKVRNEREDRNPMPNSDGKANGEMRNEGKDATLEK